MPSVKSLSKTDYRAIIGIAAALIAFGILIQRGDRYIDQCLKKSGDFEQCWEKGLAISGMGPGGAISAGMLMGYVLGWLGKEKEKEEQYNRGYWTLNPDLRQENNDVD